MSMLHDPFTKIKKPGAHPVKIRTWLLIVKNKFICLETLLDYWFFSEFCFPKGFIVGKLF